MKYALTLLALSLSFTSAQADFRPGRVRTDAIAQMEILQATGKYENVKSVAIYQNRTDGEGILSYSAKIDGKVIDFNVTKSSDTGCGEVVTAQSLDNMSSSESSTFEFRDMSRALCERMMAAMWENVTIKTKNYATGEVSTLVMQGDPEYLMLTQ